MEKKNNTATTLQKGMRVNTEKRVRSFGAYLNEVRRQIEAANVTDYEVEANEAARLYRRKQTDYATAKKAADKLAAVRLYRAGMSDEEIADAEVAAKTNGLQLNNICPAFIREWAPEFINEDGQICDRKKNDDGETYRLVPVEVWTCGKLLSKLNKAANNRKKAVAAAKKASK